MTNLSTLTIGTGTDPYRHPDASRWDIVDASTLDNDLSLEADVVVVGIGGSTTVNWTSSFRTPPETGL